jgi:hypothetical protein
MITEISEDEYI